MKLPRLLLSLLVLATLPAQAAKTYSPGELKLMIPLGNYPAEGPVTRQETHKMSREECLARSDKLSKSASSVSPSVRLVDTPQLRSTKVWGGDGAMLINCPAAGGMELKRSSYR
ncbi:hypothetical protein [Solimonas sp. SE-A11]|uniref:hypothetical protein n=1 Tax=Solimonas sp. SE-A11 TaxID=3054954 RepID=UPI00259CE14D|nr:hypothetical protein [Solimonas sp. SE-A11]MDM4770671.1 hypothetical protein [Solimonas sp. SE-A11]